jgi:uncharacterized protein YeaO (DUF488 family)
MTQSVSLNGNEPPMIRLKRAYEPPSAADGTRVLVERLWPRGLSKREAAIDLWLKEIAPSTELRKWFAHDVAKWKEFQARYREELAHRDAAVEILRERIRGGTVTLIYAAKDEEHNGALVLKDYLEARPQRRKSRRQSPKRRRTT